MGKDDKKTISIAKTDIEVDDSEDFMAFSEAEIEAINEEIKGRDQGYGLDLGERIRLGASDMSQLHDVLTGKLCEGMQLEQPSVMYLNFQDQITKDPRFKLDASKQGNYSKMSSVKVVVEQTSNGRVLVKVGPHDLSGVGGAQVRERIVTDLVNQALAQQGIHKSYKDVDVSANLGVRGRMQMLLGLFTRNDPGSHQNAYIKVAGEEHFTRWEPRKGPQSFFNDTICAMATTVMLALFEYGLKVGKISSSRDASEKILKSGIIKDTFDTMLNKKTERVKHLVDTVNENKDNILDGKKPMHTRGASPQ